MRAVVFDQFGPPDVLHIAQQPVPVAGPGEVVVKVAAATLNPTDLMMRTGQQAHFMTDLQPPYIAGMEFSGHVHQLGSPSERLQPGQAVMGIVNPRRPQGGAHCEFLSLPQTSVVPAPPGMNLRDAATLPMNGLTAWMVMQELALPRGATVLVTGGAGALGGYVIQMARHAGLKVVADASEKDRQLLEQIGAHTVLPRGTAMVAAVRLQHPLGVDGVVDAALLGDTAAHLVRDGGTLVSVRSSQRYEAPGVLVKYVGVLNQVANTQALAWLVDLASQHVLTPRVAHPMRFEQAAEAHRLLEQGGLRGRIVLHP